MTNMHILLRQNITTNYMSLLITVLVQSISNIMILNLCYIVIDLVYIVGCKCDKIPQLQCRMHIFQIYCYIMVTTPPCRLTCLLGQ